MVDSEHQLGAERALPGFSRSAPQGKRYHRLCWAGYWSSEREVLSVSNASDPEARSSNALQRGKLPVRQLVILGILALGACSRSEEEDRQGKRASRCGDGMQGASGGDGAAPGATGGSVGVGRVVAAERRVPAERQ